MKKLLFGLVAVAICCLNSLAASPTITTGAENVQGLGKIKYAQTDLFTTNLNGQDVSMRIIYSIPIKNQPEFSIVYCSPESTIYKEIENYVNNFSAVASQFKQTGSRIADIFVKDGTYTWCTGQKYGVAGSALNMVHKTIDKVNGQDQLCMMVIIPEGIMDSNRYDWNDKNHWKDFQKELLAGNMTSFRYKFIYPGGRKEENLIVPLNSEMVLVMQKLVEAYNKK